MGPGQEGSFAFTATGGEEGGGGKGGRKGVIWMFIFFCFVFFLRIGVW